MDWYFPINASTTKSLFHFEEHERLIFKFVRKRLFKFYMNLSNFHSGILRRSSCFVPNAITWSVYWLFTSSIFFTVPGNAWYVALKAETDKVTWLLIIDKREWSKWFYCSFYVFNFLIITIFILYNNYVLIIILS